MPRGQTPSEQNTTHTKGNTPSNCTPAKSHTPPSIEKTNKPQKRLNLDNTTMEVDPPADNNIPEPENSCITSSNKTNGITRQNSMTQSSTLTDGTRCNITPVLATGSNTDNKSETT